MGIEDAFPLRLDPHVARCIRPTRLNCRGAILKLQHVGRGRNIELCFPRRPRFSLPGVEMCRRCMSNATLSYLAVSGPFSMATSDSPFSI